MSKICAKCGTICQDTQEYCTHCNTLLPKMQTVSAKPPVNNQPYSGGQYNNQQQFGAQGGAGLAIASMVLGIIALVMSCLYYISIPCSVVGIILATVSLGTKRAGRGMAIAGLVCSIVAIVPTIIIIATGVALIGSL